MWGEGCMARLTRALQRQCVHELLAPQASNAYSCLRGLLMRVPGLPHA